MPALGAGQAKDSKMMRGREHLIGDGDSFQDGRGCSVSKALLSHEWALPLAEPSEHQFCHILPPKEGGITKFTHAKQQA